MPPEQKQKGDLVDFLAFTIAAYQLVLPPLLAIIALLAGLVILLRWLAG